MRNIILTLLFFTNLLMFSQFNANAPWRNNDETNKTKEKTVHQLTEEFNNYWRDKDRNVRGAGFKPFMRWQYHWQNKTNENGYIISPQEMWSAWQQKKDSKANKQLTSVFNSNWQPVGPFSHTNTGSWSSGQGRVNIVYKDPVNSNILYLGAPAGGIWKSADNGINWQPLSDELPQIGVSGIAVDHTNNNVIYISTGDKDATDTYSIGVLKSTDGGATWNTTGLSFTNTTTTSGDIIMHPNNNQILWCATSVGIYKTSNGGNTWLNVQSGDFAQGNIRLKPGDPSTIYAVSNNRFYKSTNSGDIFSVITTGLPFNSGRLVMDVTPANSSYIYILSSTTGSGFQGIYRSINSGTSWTKTSGTTNILESTQAWFDLAIAASDINADEIYTGCLNVWKSTDGGVSVTKLNNWSAPFAPAYTHADIHYLGFLGGKLYCGSDGGIYVSENGGTSFTDLTAGAQISQFYKVAVSKQSAGKMVGGLQDNGGHAYSNGAWKNYYGADGMDTAIDPTNQNLYYGFIQFGNSMYISSTAGNNAGGSVGSPGGVDGNWVTPLVANAQGELFSGFNNLFKLQNGSWVQQNTSAIGSGNLELIAIDPSNSDIMYVANGATLYKSTNHGVTFSSVYTATSNITAIEIHHSDSNIVYLTTEGTAGQALKSINGGNTFTNFSTGLPAIGKNDIVHQGRHSDNPLYLATSLGVYYRDDTMTSWQPFDTNLPNVSVTDLEINLEDSKLIAATYGRGIWQTDIPFQTPANDIKLVEFIAPSATINCSTIINPIVQVKNNGSNNITDVTINYQVNGSPSVYNWNGSITPNNFADISLPTLTLSRGVHTINATSTIFNDAYNDNNYGSTVFYTNDSGTVGITNPFTTTTDELLTFDEGATTSQWVRGIRTTGALATGSNTVYATNISGNYLDKKKSFLISQCYDLTGVVNPQISFKLQFDLEQDWDIIYVEYTTDFGATWSVLGEMGANWYNSDRTPQTTGEDCFNCVGAQWTGTNTSFNTYSYPLNALNAETNVIFRIVFHSDDSVNQEGANVDDFLISGTLSTQNFNLQNIVVYPNPSNGIFNISYGNLTINSIEVYDILGKKVLVKDNISEAQQQSVDLSNAANGVYFIKISSSQGNTVKRIIKE